MVQMLGCRCGTGLPAETLHRLDIAGHFLGQELERYGAVESRILGLVYHAHPAATQLLDDATVKVLPIMGSTGIWVSR